MKKKTILYVGVNGDKQILKQESEARAETLFNSGQAIELNPMIWALDPKDYKNTYQAEVKKFLNGERGARLNSH